MKHALIQHVIRYRNQTDAARQRYDDASAGVTEDIPLHNAQARLDAADDLTEAAYELVNWVDNLLDQIAKDNGGTEAGDLDWLLKDEGGR